MGTCNGRKSKEKNTRILMQKYGMKMKMDMKDGQMNMDMPDKMSMKDGAMKKQMDMNMKMDEKI